MRFSEITITASPTIKTLTQVQSEHKPVVAEGQNRRRSPVQFAMAVAALPDRTANRLSHVLFIKL